MFTKSVFRTPSCFRVSSLHGTDGRPDGQTRIAMRPKAQPRNNIYFVLHIKHISVSLLGIRQRSHRSETERRRNLRTKKIIIL